MKDTVNQCNCCGVIEHGKQFNETLSLYKGHLICSFCHNFWLSQEKRLGYEIDFNKLRYARYSKKRKGIAGGLA